MNTSKEVTNLKSDLQASALEQSQNEWSGTFEEFLDKVFSKNPTRYVRTSHEYMYDMLCWYGDKRNAVQSDEDEGTPKERALFEGELFGIDSALDRFTGYFKAAAAGSDVSRRLLLLLGPPSGGKSSMVILMKKALEEYGRTDAGALYALDTPVNESPLSLIPHHMRDRFKEEYGVNITGDLSPYAAAILKEKYKGDFMQFPVKRIFPSEGSRTGIGTYAPHDPTTADIADLVGSVDLSKVAEIGDEGDPRAWSWSGAVYAANRGILEMIEILKVKREFLYLLLTLTQEKNVKVSRFPLIHIDETILAHTNLAEFNRFIQEKENEALLDRMVIVRVPYTLDYYAESRIYDKLIANVRALRGVHLDPHVLHLASVFAILTRLDPSEREGLDLTKKLKLYAGWDVEGFSESDIDRIHADSPGEGLEGISPRFIVNAISNAVTNSDIKSLTSMEMLLALKDTIENDARMGDQQKKHWIDFLVVARKDFYNHWVKEDVHKALFTSFEDEAQELLDKYLDEVESQLDNQEVTDPITGESRDPDERFLRAVEEKINITESGAQSFRQEVVRKAMIAYKGGEKFTLERHAQMREAIEQFLFEERRDVLRLVSSAARPDEEAQKKISAVQQRLIDDYGYDEHSAKEALDYVTTLLGQE